LVLGRALRLAAIGLVTGVLLSIGLSRAIASMLFGVEPIDFITYSCVLATVAIVTLAAAAMPAWRAARIDPVIALREE